MITGNRTARCGKVLVAIAVLLIAVSTANADNARGVPSDVPCSYLIGNGGFETGDFSQWATTGSPWVVDDRRHSGTYSVALGDGDSENESVFQYVTIPGSATSAVLRYWWYIETEESQAVAYDRVWVEAQTGSGEVLAVLETLDNTWPLEEWRQSYIDMMEITPDLLGQAMRLAFHAVTDGSNRTTFYVDDVDLQVCEGICSCFRGHTNEGEPGSTTGVLPYTSVRLHQMVADVWELQEVVQSSGSGEYEFEYCYGRGLFRVIEADPAGYVSTGVDYTIPWGNHGSVTVLSDNDVRFDEVPCGDVVVDFWDEPDEPECPDEYEPNEGMGEEAIWIDPGAVLQSYVCHSADLDYYRFTAEQGQMISVDLFDLPWDYDLVLYGPDQQELARSAFGGAAPEKIEWTAAVPGPHYVQVFGYNGAFDPVEAYSLLVSLRSPPVATHTPTPSATPTEQAPCTDDGYEDNDWCASGVELGEGYYPELQICPWDEDWYEVHLEAGDTLIADVRFAHAQGDLDVGLFAGDCSTVLQQSVSVTDDEQIWFAAPTGGTYHLHVYGYMGAGNSYEVYVEIDSAEDTPTPTPSATPATTSGCPETTPDDDFASANALAIGVDQYDYVCDATDVDFYSFWLNAGDTITIDLSDLEVDYAIVLYDQPTEPSIASSDNFGSANETISHTATHSGTHYVRVYSAIGDFSTIYPYRLKATAGGPTPTPTPTATATPTTTPPYPGCPDGFEYNDTFDLARPLPNNDTGYWSYICAANDLDYWSLAATTGQTIHVVLKALPKDYRISLYRPDRTLAKDDATSGTADKSLTFVADADGTWYVLVQGHNGASDTSAPYNVAAQVLGCVPDAREGNPGPSQAYDLTSVYGQGHSEPELSICPPGDEDWFKVTLAAGDQFTTEVTHLSSTDMVRLCLLDSDGQTVMDCTPGKSNFERLSKAIAASADYYLQITAASAQFPTNREYHLWAQAIAATSTPSPTPTATPTPTPRFPSCPDPHEDNDTPATAQILSAAVSSYICDDKDIDWWKIPVTMGTARHTVIQLELDHPKHEYHLILYRPDGKTPVTPGIETGRGREQVASFPVDQDGTWYARVRSWGLDDHGDPVNPYKLHAQVLSCDDMWEPNDTFDTARPLGLGSQLSAQAYLCRSWDKDYYTFRVEAGQRITASLGGYLQDHELTLYDPWRGKIDATQSALTHDASTNGEYIIRVQSKSGVQYTPNYTYDLRVYLGPKPSLPERDLRLLDMVVIQSIQNLANDTPLIQDKHTYARLYVSGGQHVLNGVKGYLSARLNGKELSPPQVPCDNAVTAYGVQQTTAAMRDSWSSSLNCTLPAGWLSKTGDLEITGHVHSTQIHDPVLANNAKSDTLKVEASSPLIIQAVQIRDGCDPGQCTESDGPSFDDYSDIHHKMQSMYPLNRVRLIPHRGPGVVWGNDTTENSPTIDALGQISLTTPITETHIMGMVRGSVKIGTQGLGAVGGRVTWVEVGAGEKSQRIAAHELAHNLEQNHVDKCGATRPRSPLGGDGDYTTFRGAPRIDDGDVSNYWGLNTLTNPPTVLKPSDTDDLMTYCSSVWLSHHHYDEIRSELRNRSGLPLAQAATVLDGEYLIVSGSLNAATGAVYIRPLPRIHASEVNPDAWTNPEGPYSARLVDSSGVMLAERAFGLAGGSHAGAASSILLLLPHHSAVRGLQIWHGAELLHSQMASTGLPSVDLDDVSGSVSDPLLLSWTGSDSDGDELSYTLLLSTDGVNWQIIGSGLSGSQVELATSVWPATEQGWLRIQASDGMNTAEDVEGPFSVPGKAPLILSYSPAMETTVPAGHPLSFLATCYDPEDGTLDGDAIIWSSNRDGDLGTGSHLPVPELSWGWHRISLSARDSDENVTSKSIRVYAGNRYYLPVLVKD